MESRRIREGNEAEAGDGDGGEDNLGLVVCRVRKLLRRVFDLFILGYLRNNS